jgi:hypothetical protein
MAMPTVTGNEELDRVLRIIQNDFVAKAMKPAMSAGLRTGVKFMKAAVPAPFKDAKKALGWRFNKSKRNGELMAKAGAAVGMKTKQIKKTAGANFLGRVGRPGVGIGARNIMWWILGTAQRFTGSTRIRSKKVIAATGASRMPTGGAVHSTGSMPPQMDPVREGYRHGATSIIETIRNISASCLAKLAT